MLSSNEQVQRVAMEIITAAIAHRFAKGAEKGAREGKLIASVVKIVSRKTRDDAIGSALKDGIPDLNDVGVRGVQRVIILYIDKELSFRNLAKATFKDELKAALAKENP